MLFLTNPKGMTSPVIPLINFSIMGSSSVVYWAGGGGGWRKPAPPPIPRQISWNSVTSPTHPEVELLCYALDNLHLNKAITMDHDTFNLPECWLHLVSLLELVSQSVKHQLFVQSWLVRSLTLWWLRSHYDQYHHCRKINGELIKKVEKCTVVDSYYRFLPLFS